LFNGHWSQPSRPNEGQFGLPCFYLAAHWSFGFISQRLIFCGIGAIGGHHVPRLWEHSFALSLDNCFNLPVTEISVFEFIKSMAFRGAAVSLEQLDIYLAAPKGTLGR
jgi:hypothetical protein